VRLGGAGVTSISGMEVAEGRGGDWKELLMEMVGWKRG